MKFSALLIPKAGWPELLDRARSIEQSGFDTLFVDDHLTNLADPAGAWFDSFGLLAALSQQLTQVRLGTLVANCVVRSPHYLIQQARTVQQLSGAPLVLGVGAGYAASDYRGKTRPDLHERSARFAAAAAQIAAGFAQTQAPRLLVAGHHRPALRTVARHGQGWVSFGGFGLSADEHLAVTARRCAVLDDECRRLGRDPATVERVLLAGSAGVTAEPIWTDPELMNAFIARYNDIGINHLVLYQPAVSVWPDRQVDPAAEHEILTAVLPGWR